MALEALLGAQGATNRIKENKTKQREKDDGDKKKENNS